MTRPLRSLAYAAVLLSLSGAAIARDSDRTGQPLPTGSEMAPLIDQLQNPANQARIGQMLETVLGAMLAMKAEPLAKAADAAGAAMGHKGLGGSIPKDATLGDLAGPEARTVPQRARQMAPAMMAGMAGMAGAMQAMLPELAKVAQQMGGKLGERSGG